MRTRRNGRRARQTSCVVVLCTQRCLPPNASLPDRTVCECVLVQNTFNVDLEKYPLWQQARCYDYVAIPGDTLYYPPNYWHQTMNLDEETIALTSRILHPSNYKLVFNKFR
eukprot:COSAG02_NODE_554_length_20414_cov_67.356535_15_plen_111_part_00